MSSSVAAKQLIRVGHSPDPDDAFMFHALANDCLDTGRYKFVHELVDIETLNRRAFAAELELTAVSIHAYAFLQDKYALCSCGASMGDGYGPMVVTRDAASLDDVRNRIIAVPGTLTWLHPTVTTPGGSGSPSSLTVLSNVAPTVTTTAWLSPASTAGARLAGGPIAYSTCSSGAPDGSPSYDSATRRPLPLMITANALPDAHPDRLTISWMTGTRSAVR